MVVVAWLVGVWIGQLVTISKGLDVRNVGSGAMAHKNVNLVWLKPLMGDLKLIELFLCCDICGRQWWRLGSPSAANESTLGIVSIVLMLNWKKSVDSYMSGKYPHRAL